MGRKIYQYHRLSTKEEDALSFPALRFLADLARVSATCDQRMRSCILHYGRWKVVYCFTLRQDSRINFHMESLLVRQTRWFVGCERVVKGRPHRCLWRRYARDRRKGISTKPSSFFRKVSVRMVVFQHRLCMVAMVMSSLIR